MTVWTDGTSDQGARSIDIAEGISTAALAKLPLALVLTNPHLPDNPIVYANRAFERITRYAAGAAIGRNCRFLQGPETDPRHGRMIAEAVEAERDVSLDIVNYRADGTRFLNRLMITPLYDGEHRLQCFLGIQRDMSDGADMATADDDGGEAGRAFDQTVGEIQHRVKNHLAMIIGMIRMQARVKTSDDAFHALARRIESLQLLYQEMTEAGVSSTSAKRVPLGAYISRIASTIGYLDGRDSVRVNVDCDAIEVNVERAARIGLLFSELLTNALKHAFTGRREGLVEARLKMMSSGVIRLTVTDDGVGLPKGSNWPHPAPRDPPEPGEGQSVSDVVDMTSGADATREIARAIGQSITGNPPVERPAQEAPHEGRSPSTGLGGRITLSLVRGLDARLDVNSATQGTTVTVDIAAED